MNFCEAIKAAKLNGVKRRAREAHQRFVDASEEHPICEGCGKRHPRIRLDSSDLGGGLAGIIRALAEADEDEGGSPTTTAH